MLETDVGSARLAGIRSSDKLLDGGDEAIMRSVFWAVAWDEKGSSGGSEKFSV